MVKTISFRFLKTLKFKVIFALVILTFGPIITFSFISLKQSYTALKQSEINKLVSKTNLLAVNANRYIESRANQIRLISQADVFEGNKLKEIDQYLKEVKASSLEIKDVDLYLIDGTQIGSADDDQDLKEKDFTFQQEFQPFIETFNMATQGHQDEVFILLREITPNQNEIILITPVTDDKNEQVVKVLLMQLAFQHLNKLLVITQAETNSIDNVVIIDKNGELIASAKATDDLQFDLQKRRSILNKITKNNKTSDHLVEEEVFATTKYLGYTKTNIILDNAITQEWFVIAFGTQKIILEPLNAELKQFVSIALGFTLIIIILILLVYWSVIRPFASALVLVNKISAGDYSIRLKQFKSIELIDLENAFNALLDKFNGNLDQLTIANTELKKSLEREKELGILKTSFVSMASHEFRTPLAAINATADVILKYHDKLNQDEIQQRLEKIKREVQDMTIMLEDILIIGKSDSQKLNFDPQPLNLVEAIKEIISEYQLSETEKRIIRYDIEASEIKVSADKKWIKHIVINLLSNAIKYSNSDKEIEVMIMEGQSGISFSFKDYGIGISKEDLKLLFDPFHRGKNVGNISGTGLGLSVLEKAVALHGGKITVESELGKGSTFNVILPTIN